MYMNKERVIGQSVKWIKENLPAKTVKEISYTIVPQVRRLAYNAHRFSREQDSQINGKHIYRGQTYAFYLKIERKYGLFGDRSLVLGPKGSLQNASAFAKHGVTQGMFGTATKNMVIGALFIPPNRPRNAMSCTSFSHNIPFMIYEHPTRDKQRTERISKKYSDRWSFHKPRYYSYCDDDVVQDQLEENDDILRRKGF